MAAVILQQNQFLYIIMDYSELMKGAAMVCCVLAADYAGVLAALLADLRSGISRARREGRPLTSRGYRDTVDKAGRYYITLFAMTAIDAMIVAAVFFLRHYTGMNLPPLPLFTTAGAVGLGVIELKSIMENTRSGDSLKDATKVLKRLFENKEVRKLAEKLLNIDK